MKLHIKLFDFLILLAFLAISAFSIVNLFTQKDIISVSLVIESNDNKYYYQLDKNQDIKVDGILGTSIIRIQNNTAFFLDSPCPNHTCMTSTPISKSGDWSACLPNGVFIRIEGNDKSSNAKKDFVDKNTLEDTIENDNSQIKLDSISY